MPNEVQIGGRTERLDMADGTGSIALPAGAHVVIGPDGKVLRRSADIDELQRWQYETALTRLAPGAERPPAPCIAAS